MLGRSVGRMVVARTTAVGLGRRSMSLLRDARLHNVVATHGHKRTVGRLAENGMRWNNGMFMQQVRGLFIQTEETPNPQSLKFVPGQLVLPEEFGTSMDFSKDSSTQNSPLARLLLRIDGVTGVFFGRDFITVTISQSLSWSQIKPEIFASIMDFYATGKPAVTGAGDADDSSVNEDDSEIVALIKELLEERVRPAVQDDGGDIFFRKFDEDTGIVTVKLAGSCSGCPSSTVTLKQGVESMLMHYLPEVNGVHAEGELDETNDDRALSFKADPA